jgi:heme exporter protein CcmD
MTASAYTVYILASYGFAACVLGTMVVGTFWRYRHMRRALQQFRQDDLI